MRWADGDTQNCSITAEGLRLRARDGLPAEIFHDCALIPCSVFFPIPLLFELKCDSRDVSKYLGVAMQTKHDALT